MKKETFKIMLCITLCSVLVIGNVLSLKAGKDKDKPVLSKDTLNVIIYDEQSKEGQAKMEAFDKYWTYSKYKFISPEEFKRINNDKNKFFMTTMVYDFFDNKGNLSDHIKLFVIFRGGNDYATSNDNNKFISFHPHTHRNDLSNPAILYKMVYYSSAHGYTDTDYMPIYIADFNSRISNLINRRFEAYTKSDDKALYLFNNTTLDSLKGKTLFIDKQFCANDYFLGSFSEDTLRSDYSKALRIPKDNVVILGKEEILKLFESGNKDQIYLIGNLNAYIKFLGKSSPLSAIFNYKGKNLVWVNTRKATK